MIPRRDPDARATSACRRCSRDLSPAAPGPGPGDRADRVGQVDDPGLDHRPDQQQPRLPHPHHRGPDRVRPRPQAGGGQPARGRHRHRDLPRRAALASLREDPDVLLVGEMRDLESIRFALTIAETGHLVFATLHTNDTAQSIARMIDVFPAEQQAQVRVQLAAALTGVVYQRLIPRVGGGMVARLRGAGRQLRGAQPHQGGQDPPAAQLAGHRARATAWSPSSSRCRALVQAGVVTYDDAVARSLYPQGHRDPAAARGREERHEATKTRDAAAQDAEPAGRRRTAAATDDRSIRAAAARRAARRRRLVEPDQIVAALAERRAAPASRSRQRLIERGVDHRATTSPATVAEHYGVEVVDFRHDHAGARARPALLDEAHGPALRGDPARGSTTTASSWRSPTRRRSTSPRSAAAIGRPVVARSRPHSDIPGARTPRYRATGEVEHARSRRSRRATACAARPTQLEAAQRQRGRAGRPVVQMIITQALRDRASDIHIEPQADRVRVRYRIDGALHDVLDLPGVHGPGDREPDQDPRRA